MRIRSALSTGASIASPTMNFTSASPRVLARFLAEGQKAVQERGKAKCGDKTMIDALDPAQRKAAEMIDRPLVEVLENIFEAARTGMESTKEMVATIGKAKTLGERSLGYPDPGAVSMQLIFKFMYQYVSGLGK